MQHAVSRGIRIGSPERHLQKRAENSRSATDASSAQFHRSRRIGHELRTEFPFVFSHPGTDDGHVQVYRSRPERHLLDRGLGNPVASGRGSALYPPAFRCFPESDYPNDRPDLRHALLLLQHSPCPPITVLLLLLTGLIPATIFSKIPVTVAYRGFLADKHLWKQTLLFIQFTGITLTLFLLTTVARQHRMMLYKDPGYNVERMVYTDIIRDMDVSAYRNTKAALLALPFVESVCTGMNPALGPGCGCWNTKCSQ